MSDDRRAPRIDGDEKETLLGLLDYLRDSVIRKVAGLDASVARESFVGSRTNLVGLVAHLANVERYWCRTVIAGEEPDSSSSGFDVEEGISVVEVTDEYRAAAAVSNEIIRSRDLSSRGAGPEHSGETVTVRWVLAHLVEETARHAGHADILRELTDGVVGR